MPRPYHREDTPDVGDQGTRRIPPGVVHNEPLVRQRGKKRPPVLPRPPRNLTPPFMRNDTTPEETEEQRQLRHGYRRL